MSKFLLLARAAHGYEPMNLDAHARFSCGVNGLFGRVANAISGAFANKQATK